MILAKKYRIIKKESYYCIQSYDESVCPNCNSKLKVRGSKHNPGYANELK